MVKYWPKVVTVWTNHSKVHAERSRANIYILLTKSEGRTGRISARGLDSTEDRGAIFSEHGPEQAWLIRDLLYV